MNFLWSDTIPSKLFQTFSYKSHESIYLKLGKVLNFELYFSHEYTLSVHFDMTNLLS